MDQDEKEILSSDYPDNGLPQAVTLTSNNTTQLADQPLNIKKSRWRYYFATLSTLQIMGVAFFFLVWALVSGQPGSEFVALLLYITLVPAIAIIALLNLVGLPFYINNQKPRGKSLVFYVVSLVVSVILVGYGAYSAYQVFYVLPKHVEKLHNEDRSSDYTLETRTKQNVVSNENTEQEALDLLSGCRADYFVGQTGKEPAKDASTQAWLVIAEKSTTGIAISVDSPKTYIFASKAMTNKLENTAREYRNTCYNKRILYLIIDNWYETEYPKGTWIKVKL